MSENDRGVSSSAYAAATRRGVSRSVADVGIVPERAEELRDRRFAGVTSIGPLVVHQFAAVPARRGDDRDPGECRRVVRAPVRGKAVARRASVSAPSSRPKSRRAMS